VNLDESIQRLMDLLAQVRLRSTQGHDSEPPPAAPSPFDPETTVVDDDVASSSIALPQPPEIDIETALASRSPPESLARLIVAPRLGDDDGLVARSSVDDEDATARIAIAQSREPLPASPPMAFDVAQAARDDSSFELPADQAFGDGDEIDGGIAEREERSPASSRRPVLPDDVAPALPDSRWDEDSSTSDAPPESGQMVASSGQMLAHPANAESHMLESKVPPSSRAAHVGPVAAFVGALKAPTNVTFGALVDASLEL
jgi:hypothetical protein